MLKIQDEYKDAMEGERGGQINWEIGIDIYIYTIDAMYKIDN